MIQVHHSLEEEKRSLAKYVEAGQDLEISAQKNCYKRNATMSILSRKGEKLRGQYLKNIQDNKETWQCLKVGIEKET